MTTDVVDVEHGVAEGMYSNLPGPMQSPILVCLCGFEAISWSGREHGGTWAEAGEILDDHLAETAVAS